MRRGERRGAAREGLQECPFIYIDGGIASSTERRARASSSCTPPAGASTRSVAGDRSNLLRYDPAAAFLSGCT